VKILITGAAGMLAHALYERLRDRHDVTPLTYRRWDVTDYRQSVALVASLKPDLVIHAAGFTDVDGCQQEAERAYAVNALGTRNVALACQQWEVALLYLSTDYVFDGRKKEPYHEFDMPNPLSTYARSKLAGEEYVRTLVRRFFVVRSSRLFGPGGENFPTKFLKAAEKSGRLRMVADQVSSPTYTRDLARKIGELIEEERYGLYHISNSGGCSWYEYGLKILELTRREDLQLIPVASADYPTPAPRPPYSVLRNLVLELEGQEPLRPWHEALQEYLAESVLRRP